MFKNNLVKFSEYIVKSTNGYTYEVLLKRVGDEVKVYMNADDVAMKLLINIYRNKTDEEILADIDSRLETIADFLEDFIETLMEVFPVEEDGGDEFISEEHIIKGKMVS